MAREKIVSVQIMCQAREKRVLKQRKLLSKYNLPLISFTLNIPGKLKDKELYRKIFREGIISARDSLNNNKIRIINLEYYYEVTGPEGYFVIDFDSKIVKRLMLEIEEKHPLGRIFDFDVINQYGILLSRLDFTNERKCFICEKPGKICARSYNHEIKKILDKIEELAETFFNENRVNLRNCSKDHYFLEDF